jgi:hypothetical protein
VVESSIEISKMKMEKTKINMHVMLDKNAFFKASTFDPPV